VEKQAKLYLAVKCLASVGIILALFLLWEQLFHPSFKPCSINSSINCDAIVSGAVAKTFGIPTPFYGLTGYIVILLAAILRKRKLLFGFATFGLLFCLYIAFVEIVMLHVICPVCILCDIDIISVFTLSILLLRQKS
jgi:uncharacterized membrane protein